MATVRSAVALRNIRQNTSIATIIAHLRLLPFAVFIVYDSFVAPVFRQKAVAVVNGESVTECVVVVMNKERKLTAACAGQERRSCEGAARESDGHGLEAGVARHGLALSARGS